MHDLYSEIEKKIASQPVVNNALVLYLERQKMHDKDIEHVIQYAKLLYKNHPPDLWLYLSRNKLTYLCTKKLYDYADLMVLDLSCNDIGNAGAAILATYPFLNSLTLCNSQITNQGAIALLKNTRLTLLDLSVNTDINNGIATAVRDNTSLVALYLCDTAIDSKGAKVIALNTTLKTLDLSENMLEDEGAKALSQNSTMTDLNLSHCDIRCEGAIALAKNKTLTSLDLSSNSITTKGAKALVSHLNLKFSLKNNPLDQIGLAALAEKDPIKRSNLGKEAGITTEVPTLSTLSFFACKKYQQENLIPLQIKNNVSIPFYLKK